MRLALLNERGGPRVAVVQPDSSYRDLTATLSAFAEITGRDLGPLPESPFAVTQEAARWSDLYAEATETLDANGLPATIYPADAPLLAPIPRPNRILAIGRNYSEHARELGNTVGEEPIVFLKASSSVIGPNENIVIPSWAGRVDFEAELLVVIGTGGREIAETDTLRHVSAYSVFNDVTAREKQRALQEKKHPWFLAKSLDTFGPLGPYLVTADALPDPHSLPLRLTVNGETRQNDTTGSMIFRIPFLISYLSRWFALEPGDVIATGTPSGVGPLVPGDIVEAALEGIGSLRNPVTAG